MRARKNNEESIIKRKNKIYKKKTFPLSIYIECTYESVKTQIN